MPYVRLFYKGNVVTESVYIGKAALDRLTKLWSLFKAGGTEIASPTGTFRTGQRQDATMHVSLPDLVHVEVT